MGLNTTHGCWDGPSTQFNLFREWIAKQIGFDLYNMQGFGGTISFDIMKHPIKPLLDHSDCNGILTPNECRSIVKGVQMILDGIDNDDWGEWEVRLQIFANGCRKAADKGDTIEFH